VYQNVQKVPFRFGPKQATIRQARPSKGQTGNGPKIELSRWATSTINGTHVTGHQASWARIEMVINWSQKVVKRSNTQLGHHIPLGVFGHLSLPHTHKRQSGKRHTLNVVYIPMLFTRRS